MENLPRITCEAMRRPSAWVKRFAPLFDPREEVLDLAAGEGRHTAWLLLTGHRVLAVDRDVSVFEPLVGSAALSPFLGEPSPGRTLRHGNLHPRQQGTLGTAFATVSLPRGRGASGPYARRRPDHRLRERGDGKGACRRADRLAKARPLHAPRRAARRAVTRAFRRNDRKRFRFGECL